MSNQPVIEILLAIGDRSKLISLDRTLAELIRE